MTAFTGMKFLVFGVAARNSIAWAITKRIAKNGGSVFLASQPDMERFVSKLAPSLGIGCAGVQYVDVLDDDHMEQLANKFRADSVVFDGIVHAIAWTNKEQMRGRFSHVTRENFRITLDVSCFSLIDICHQFQPFLRTTASVLTLTFDASRGVYEGYNLMGTAKAALENAVLNLAVDLGEFGIRVNALSTSPQRTLSAKAVPGYLAIGADAELRSALGGRASLDEVAEAAAFLLSPASSGITGQIINVDRGTSAVRMALARNIDGEIGDGENRGEYFLRRIRDRDTDE